MDTLRYMHVRKELIRIHSILTEETFLVIMPTTSFMTLKQLEFYKDNPPIVGFEALETPQERPYSIVKILEAFKNVGDDAQVHFRYPSRDIPRIYEAIQDWIRYWIEIKRGSGYLRTPSIEELELIEKLARHIFTAYSHYHYSKIFDTLNVSSKQEMTLLDVLKGRMMYGSDIDEELSYISYLDEYKSETGFQSSAAQQIYSGFGGGM
uniref:Uncharacterized protein n=1 Tax=Pantoea phage Survivor TaxID=3232176 RepID=A0AAU8KZH7_9CAUD